MDKRIWGRPGAKIGMVAAGKNWLDLSHALSLLGIDAAEAERLGITTYKVGQTFPLDMKGFHDWAEGLEVIIVVEEKRKLIEVQVKEAIFDDRRGRRVLGWHHDRTKEELFPTRYALDPLMIAEKIGGILIEEGRGTEAVKAGLARIGEARRADNARDMAARLPYFCSGCPHNSSTKVPEGSRAYAGIGCHYMVQWMDRDTSGFTHMGGEGANWIGEAPFSNRDHVFQNLGDGTYNHSGAQAIRAALAANVNITYKILFNDAVAMTGGQFNEGGLTPSRIAREVLAMGVRELALVHDPKENLDLSKFPAGISIYTRDALESVQKRLAKVPGVTVLLYVQTCAAEKRRRRKKGSFPEIDKRVFINTDICEGCGDCGIQSNCVSVVPVETELGRKRAIDQSSCNKDFSCVQGFCPSFVTLEGAKPRKAEGKALTLPDLPEPALPAIRGTHNIVITGVGGTGVVTIGAILAMAAHLDGKGAGMMEMAGLAQKGGAVHIHCRIAECPADISAIRVAVGEADAVIGGDLVVTAGAKTLGLMTTGRTRAVVNDHDIVTGEFTRNTEFRIPSEDLRVALQARLREGVRFVDATELARVALGDSIFSNMLMLGMAWQAGLVPLSEPALREAVRLNGAGVEANLRAFDLGRFAQAYPDQAKALMVPVAVAPVDPVAYRAAHLRDWQDEALAARYLARVNAAPASLRLSLAKGYHKLLAYKDEYEVARLHLQTLDKAKEQLTGDMRPTFHLAPPVLPGKGADGRPQKRAFGPWILPVFRLLARMKRLRGTVLDPFGWHPERKMERALIAEYEADLDALLPLWTAATEPALRELLELPLTIRGYGPVKTANAAKAAARRLELIALIRAGGDAPRLAA